MESERRLRGLRRLQRTLDSAFAVPGTRIRFGWDPIIGLIPWAGDALTAMLACAIVVQAHRMRVPRVVQLRMLLNVGIDMLVGIVPLVGDVADVFWQANRRNMRLLEQHAALPVPASVGDWVFVGFALAMVLATAAIPPLLFYFFLRLIGLA